MKRIVIVDDHYLLRAGWASLIDSLDGLEICGSAGSVPEALEVIEQTTPDLVITDLTLPERSGLELIKDLQVLYPELPVLVVSMHDEHLYGERVLKAGGRGYLMKEVASEQLVAAVRKVLDGEIYISPNLADRFFRALSGKSKDIGSPLSLLTDREMEVFELIGGGESLEAIADRLRIRARTVEAHRANIRKKLSLPDSNALLRYAVRWQESGGVRT